MIFKGTVKIGEIYYGGTLIGKVLRENESLGR